MLHEASNHLDKLALEKGYIIFFHDGVLENGQPYYLYLAVKGSNIQKYSKLLKMTPVPPISSFKKIGTVLAFGEGVPASELKDYLRHMYGICDPT